MALAGAGLLAAGAGSVVGGQPRCLDFGFCFDFGFAAVNGGDRDPYCGGSYYYCCSDYCCYHHYYYYCDDYYYYYCSRFPRLHPLVARGPTAAASAC